MALGKSGIMQGMSTRIEIAVADGGNGLEALKSSFG